MSPFFFPEERSRIESEHASESAGAFRRSQQGSASKAELVRCGHGYACSFFEPADQTCRVYAARPFDCAMYPAVVMRSSDGNSILLGADTKCPALGVPGIAQRVPAYLDFLQEVFQRPEWTSRLREHPEFVAPYQEEVVQTRELALGKA